MYGTRLITWQKPNGDLVNREVTYDIYHIGQTNAYKWTVKDIKYYLGNGKFGTEHDLERKWKHQNDIEKIKLELRNAIKSIPKKILTITESIIIIKVIELLLNSQIDIFLKKVIDFIS